MGAIISSMSTEQMIDVLALYSGKLTGEMGQDFEDTLREWMKLPARHTIDGVGDRMVISINEVVHNDRNLARRLLRLWHGDCLPAPGEPCG